MKKLTKNLKIGLTFSILLGFNFIVNAQMKIGNNPSSINSNSLLELESTNKGLLLPRIALTSTNDPSPLSTYVAGMVIYNTATAGTAPNNVVPGYYMSDGTSWVKIALATDVVNVYNSNGTLTGDRVINQGNSSIAFSSTASSGSNHFSVDGSTFSVNAARNSVGIGTTNPSLSAALDVSSTTKGFLLPRMTNEQMKAIVSPANGLTVFNTTLGCIAYFVDSSITCIQNVPSVPASIAPIGSTYTSHSNGSELFSDNTTCENKHISAQGCAGMTQVVGKSGTVYPLVDINGQCWFQTNLREVPENFYFHTPLSWLNTTQPDLGYWGYYHTTQTNGTSGWGLSEPSAGEGLLYQWSAVMNNSMRERSRGICPQGFHIPSDCEWMYLEHGLGMSIAEQNNTGNGGVRINGDVGGKLSTLTRLTPSSANGTGSNSSGFTALLSGNRTTGGDFNGRSASSVFWTSTHNMTTRSLANNSSGFGRNNFSNAFGFPVRCIKD